MYEKSHARQGGGIYLKLSKNRNIVKYYNLK